MLQRVFLVLLFVLLAVEAQEGSYKIFVLHSYSQEYAWTKQQHQGFVEHLQANRIDFEIFSEYLDTKRLALTPQSGEAFIDFVTDKYARSGITMDAVYTTDDDALNVMLRYYKKEEARRGDLAYFFSGINDAHIQSRLPQKSFFGVLETKEIEPNIALVHQFSPQTRDIWFVGDASTTDVAIMRAIKTQESHFPTKTFHYISQERIEDAIAQLPQNARTFVFLTTIGAFKDATQQTLSLSQSIARLRSDTQRVLLSMEDAYMQEGVVGGYTTNAYEQGKAAAQLVIEHLKSSSRERSSFVVPSPNGYIFDRDALKQARLVLSQYLARQATLTQHSAESKKESQYAQAALEIGIIVLLVVGAIVLFFFVYVHLRHRKLTALLRSKEELSSALLVRSRQFKMILTHRRIATWQLELSDERFCTSKSMQKLLARYCAPCYEWAKFKEHFLDDNLQKFNDTIAKVIQTHQTQQCTLRMITLRNELLETTHIVSYHQTYFGKKVLILGVIIDEQTC